MSDRSRPSQVSGANSRLTLQTSISITSRVLVGSSLRSVFGFLLLDSSTLEILYQVGAVYLLLLLL